MLLELGAIPGSIGSPEAPTRARRVPAYAPAGRAARLIGPSLAPWLKTIPGSSNIRPGADISHIHPLTDITFFNNVNFFCSITLFCFSAISLFVLHFSL